MMERKHQRAMLASIVHIVNGDWASVVYDLTEMDVVPPKTNLRRVTMVIQQTAAVSRMFYVFSSVPRNCHLYSPLLMSG
jgi:hypothetical protein